MSLDADRVHTLLNIADMAKQWPKLLGIHDKAMAELEDISAASAKEVQEKKAAAALKAAEEKAKADAAAKVEADKAQAPTGPRVLVNTQREDTERRV